MARILASRAPVRESRSSLGGATRDGSNRRGCSGAPDARFVPQCPRGSGHGARRGRFDGGRTWLERDAKSQTDRGVSRRGCELPGSWLTLVFMRVAEHTLARKSQPAAAVGAAHTTRCPDDYSVYRIIAG